MAEELNLFRRILKGPHSFRHFLRGLLRFLLITAVMMGVGWVLEKALDTESFSSLSKAQTQAFAAVKGINPLQIKDRYLCALTNSVERQNRTNAQYIHDPSLDFLSHAPASSDCKYKLATLLPDSSPTANNVLPSPVVGHWAEGSNGILAPFIAFLDTAWHLIIQPSIFASVFAIFAFVAGAIITAILLTFSRIPWHPYLMPVLFAVGTVVAACLVAWCLLEFMEGALYVFGRVTKIAGLACGGAGITYFGYTFSLKAIEVRVHEGVDHVLPH